ncbi:MAG: hypothetical protein IPN23_10860 [Elusimicrobia bacterium]|nr:hypothetical protein [Elusimicrobiota bacterium]
MKKEIVDIDPARGVFRVTTDNERFYIRPSKNKTTGLPDYEYAPSVTYITSFYPKGPQLTKWIAEQGGTKQEKKKTDAGARGSRIHAAVAALVGGGTVTPDMKFDGVELAVDEYAAVLNFRDWFEATRPEVLGSEFLIWNDEHNYAGTVDLKVKINGEVWVIDLKSSKSVYPEYALQLSAYKKCIPDATRIGVLQVGYTRSKSGWKFTELDDKFDVFLATKRVFENETAGAKPLQREFPLSISIRLPKDAK